MNLESLIERTDGRKYSFEILSTAKVGKYIPRGYLTLTIWTFDGIKNNYNVSRGEHCMKKFCKCLREHAVNKRTKVII